MLGFMNRKTSASIFLYVSVVVFIIPFFIWVFWHLADLSQSEINKIQLAIGSVITISIIIYYIGQMKRY